MPRRSKMSDDVIYAALDNLIQPTLFEIIEYLIIQHQK